MHGALISHQVPHTAIVRNGRGLDDPVPRNLPAGERQEHWIQIPQSSPAVETTARQ